MQLFEYLERTDVRRPARTAPREHQPDSRSMGAAESRRGHEAGGRRLHLGRDWRRRAGRWGHPAGGVLGIGAAHDREPDGRDEVTEDPAKGPDRPC